MRISNNIDFESTFNHFEGCFFTKDTAHRYTFVNDTVCQLFGVKKDDILGKTDTDFFNLALCKELHKNDQIALQCISISKVKIHILKDQAVKHYQIIKSPLYNDDGALLGLFGIAIDVTESIIKVSELEFLAMYDQLTGVL